MNVLVPIDESDPAMEAVEHVIREYPDASVTLLHVIEPNTYLYGDGAAYAYDSLIEPRRDAAENLFDAARESAGERDRPFETETVVGIPARKIVEFAGDGEFDHIVIGSHGRSGPTRVLLGSVAERVLRRAPCPVTIVR
ncbi:universal stress protein [Halovivax gelatinilyticus]|uniref:universal stress protein n=1 Tax=Halovivax gelatinilyticus TaxID=2961597 RepID=UPI0020CA9275|nr:universal stress protein [Halovivax gelatinilyticus]